MAQVKSERASGTHIELMALILLIRHGENEYTRTGKLAGHTPGVSLNAAGQKQAQALVERLKPLPIQQIYSSPLERARETAAPLAQARAPARPRRRWPRLAASKFRSATAWLR
jgi:broad specificity phosphatase PhoE